jgi:hypothetical protein
MHYLGFGRDPYPELSFGTARIWDMGVTWKDIEPSPDSPLTGTGSPGLQRLDAIISTFTRHHVDPVITLGMTPAWAARGCTHVIRGTDWGAATCAPRDTSASGPWGRYVRALATRYRDRVHFFELWNEPSLRNGWNDSIERLAQMQVTAHRILRSLGFGQRLIAPSIAFTDGAPKHGLKFLDRFLSQPGGSDFDIVGLHLYPGDEPAKAGDGPEWSMQVALPGARAVLAQHGLADRPIWNTETNVGRVPAGITFTGTSAAAMVARTFLLSTQHQVVRTIWYAADDRSWGGVWLENSDLRSLSLAGGAERTVERLIVGSQPTGCTVTQAGTRFSCAFVRPGGQKLQATWVTRGSYALTPPAGAVVYDVTGTKLPHGTVRVGAAPVYVVTR